MPEKIEFRKFGAQAGERLRQPKIRSTVRGRQVLSQATSSTVIVAGREKQEEASSIVQLPAKRPFRARGRTRVVRVP
jgi:hypothetical protein